MNVTVTEMLGRHRALVFNGSGVVECCEHGHSDAIDAARHAWRLTRALARCGMTADGRHAATQPAVSP